MTDSGYDDLRRGLADALDSAAQAQAAGSLSQISARYDEFDASIPRTDNPRFQKLHVALNFWDAWIDSSNHDWRYYDELSGESWPGLARTVAQELRADHEIGSEQVLRLWTLRTRSGRGFWARLRSRFGG